MPWEIAKAFDQSAPIGKFLKTEEINDLKAIDFSLKINNEIRQAGNSKDMIFSFDQIISYVSQFITLREGDYIFTGTPEGVGPTKIDDHFEAFIGNHKLLDFIVK